MKRILFMFSLVVVLFFGIVIIQNRLLFAVPFLRTGTPKVEVEKILPVEPNSFVYGEGIIEGPPQGPGNSLIIRFHQTYYFHFLILRFQILRITYKYDKLEQIEWRL